NAKLVKNYDNKQSKYYNLTKAIIKDRISNYSKNRGNPEKVVKKIMSIIEGKNENFRNIIGSDAKVSYLLKRLLPFKIFEKLVRYFVYISSN
ncbi:MAG: hypothetical protein LBF97_04795, partial [Elusimicrobiota bacterium]|nr:hypothetical protein [Elusimicrobiota bacterium]